MDLALDNDWDVNVPVNDLALVDDIDAIDQDIRQRLGLFFGEYFLDGRVGVPWFEQILIKKPDTQVVISILARTIMDTPGVLELLSMSMDLDAGLRTLTLAFKALTTEGVSDFTLELP